MPLRGLLVVSCLAIPLVAQEASSPAGPAASPDGFRKPSAASVAAASGGFTVNAGTRVPLALINSVSTKHSGAGDRVYLQTLFPILANNKIVIPAGSYVIGTVTEIKRPGRVKGRGELWVRFDSLTLPNGVTRDFRARLGGVDGLSNEELDKAEGKVISEGNKAGDLRTVAEAAAAGASVGVIAGAATGHYGLPIGVGSAAGAAAGMLGVLLTRGPDAILAKGSTIEMVLDRSLNFGEGDLNFGSYQPPPPPSESPLPPPKSGPSVPGPLSRLPL
jgi:type IV secretion system protein VirB10